MKTSAVETKVRPSETQNVIYKAQKAFNKELTNLCCSRGKTLRKQKYCDKTCIYTNIEDSFVTF